MKKLISAIIMGVLLINTTGCNINTSKIKDVPLNNVEVQLEWEASDAEHDLDLSAFMLNSDDKVPDNSYFVFYKNTTGPNECVIHSGDKRDDSNNIGEIVTVDLDKVDSNINKIVFTVTIDGTNEDNLGLGIVKGAHLKVVNKADGSVISTFDITSYCKQSKSTSLFAGEIINNDGSWKFNSDYREDSINLADICHMYGIETVE